MWLRLSRRQNIRSIVSTEKYDFMLTPTARAAGFFVYALVSCVGHEKSIRLLIFATLFVPSFPSLLVRGREGATRADGSEQRGVIEREQKRLNKTDKK